MKKIKVIDLLNIIASGEKIPNKIKWGDHNLTWYIYEHKALDELGDPNLFKCAGCVSRSLLNDEVEIIEDAPKEDKVSAKDFLDNQFKGLYPKEDKKIEKLGAFNIKKFYDDYPETAQFILAMFNKQEELIDRLNGKDNED